VRTTARSWRFDSSPRHQKKIWLPGGYHLIEYYPPAQTLPFPKFLEDEKQVDPGFILVNDYTYIPSSITPEISFQPSSVIFPGSFFAGCNLGHDLLAFNQDGTLRLDIGHCDDTEISVLQPGNYTFVAFNRTSNVPQTLNAAQVDVDFITSAPYTVFTPTAPTVTLTATPSSINLSESALLSWSVTNATACTASDAWTGSRSRLGGSETVTPTDTSTYTLTCTGPGGGTTTKSATVTVITNLAPVGNFETIVLPAGIIKGWEYDPDNSSVSNTIQIYFNGPRGVGTLVTSMDTSILRSDINAVFGITGNHGFEFAIPNLYKDGLLHSVYIYGVEINVLNNPTLIAGSPKSFTIAPPVAPTVTITADPSTITVGSSAQLTWTSTNTTSCTASGAWVGAQTTSGTLTVSPTVTSTYTLTCTGLGGTASQSAIITVNQPPTLTFSANPTTIDSGASSTLSWSSTNTTSCTASNAWSGTKTISGTQLVSPTTTSTYSLTCDGPGGAASKSVTVTVNPPPTPSLTFSANPTTIISGSSSLLTWSSTNTTSCVASNSWTGAHATSGSETVSPTITSTYTLTCTGPGGTDDKSVTVTVNQPPTVTIAVDPTTIDYGSHATLSWSSTNATSCVASDAWTGAQSTSGAVTVSPTITSNYTLTCTGVGGTTSQSATLTVNPPPVPTLTFSANPTTIISGSSSTLNWSSTDASTCSATDAWTGPKTLSGSLSVSPTTTAIYTLTCTGPGGSDNKSVTITVNQPPTVTFSANPTTIVSGSSSLLTWSSTNATSCVASNSWTGTKATTGSLSVSPTTTATYTLTCTGPGGSANKSVTVIVNQPPTVTIAVNPNPTDYGAQGILTWSSTNATSCTASGSWSGNQTLSGNAIISPFITSTYTLTCTGAGGSASQSVTLTVNPPPVPTLTFAADPTTITLGSSSVLTWSSTNATSCTASDAWTGTRVTSGTQTVSPLSTSTYTLTCSGPGGSVNKSATVTANVPPPVPTVTISANPTTINAGSSSLLTWSSTNATSCTASDAWSGPFATSGSQTVSPTTTSTYTLTCNGAGGASSQSATVTVVPLPPANVLPIGAFEKIKTGGIIKGWTLDPDSATLSNTVQIYINGPIGTGSLTASYATDILRTDINTAQVTSGNHGFEFTIPVLYRDGYAHKAYVYGIDINDPTKSTLLLGSPKSFTLAAPKFAIGDRVITIQPTATRAIPSTGAPDLGLHAIGELGTIVDGPIAADGGIMWKIDYDTGADGWSGFEDRFNKYTADTTPPTVPTNLTATAVSTVQINLTWSAATDNVGVTGYKIFRNGVEIATTTSTYYNDCYLTGSTSYSYTVAAFDAAGNISAQTSPVSTKTLPVSTKFVVGDRIITIQLTAARPTPYTTATNLGNHAVGELGTIVDGPTAGEGMIWWKIDYDTGPDGWSGSEDRYVKYLPPSVPANLTATAVFPTEIDLAWTASTDNTAVADYRIFRAGVLIGTSTTTSYSDINLNPATSYTYTIVAVDAEGNPSSPSNPASATTQTPVLNKFAIGDRIWLVLDTAARNIPSVGGMNLGVHAIGELGIIVDGPVTAEGGVWWKINYDTGADGWSGFEYRFTKYTPPTPPPPPIVSPTAAFGFGQGSGSSALDSSTNHNTGTLTNATWTASGKFGGALSFAGNGYVSIPDSNSLDIAGAGTLEAWVKPNVLNIWQGIIAKGDDDTNSNHNYALEISATNHALCIIGDGTNADVLESIGTITNQVFTHLACTFDGSDIRLYINSVLSGSQVQTTLPKANTAPLYVGQYGGGFDFTKATIDEVRIYKAALAQTQIQSDMNTAVPTPSV
jgi:PKD repeat protein